MKLNIGCHLSISKGYIATANDALSIDANTFAFFLRNPRGGLARTPTEKEISGVSDILHTHQFAPLVAHAPYTANPAAAKPETRALALDLIQDDVRKLEAFPGNYYNFHPGCHVSQGAEVGIDFTAQMLNKVLQPTQRTIVLIETMAGKGSEIGKTFEEIKQIIDKVQLQDKIGVCLDTCHIWDGGYDVVNDLDGVLTHFDHVIGLSNLKAIHLNDSMNPRGAHKDRHAKIGEGCIGLEALVRITCHEALKNLPFILETPNELDGYAKEIQILRENFK